MFPQRMRVHVGLQLGNRGLPLNIAARLGPSRYTERPLLLERAPVLAELHQVINAHLDEEERVVLPLCAAHVSAEEWDAFGQRALAAPPDNSPPGRRGRGDDSRR